MLKRIGGGVAGTAQFIESLESLGISDWGDDIDSGGQADRVVASQVWRVGAQGFVGGSGAQLASGQCAARDGSLAVGEVGRKWFHR